uniref:Endoribonuclease n=1 Tax=Anoplophora glabripennis TaxID=217634 RepID=V5GZ09_ANOGL
MIIAPPLDETLLNLPSSMQYNKDYAAKVLEAEYPWDDIEEPKDIERDLKVTPMDIEYYENFISQRIDKNKVNQNESPNRKNHKQLALTYHKNFVERPIKLLDKPFTKDGPDLSEMYRALTAAKANDIVNLERLETLGDSFLKLISSVYISLRFPSYDEGKATTLKGRLVSNKNLYYLAKKRNLSGIMKFKELAPKEEWLPPAFKIPQEMLKRIHSNELSVNALFNLTIPIEEQVSGRLSQDTINQILEEEYPPEENESSYSNMATFLKCQYIGDKHVADVVESLLGAYFKHNGFIGGIKFVEWMGIIPATENIENLLKAPAPDPIIDKRASLHKINFHIPCWQEIEDILGYQFKNRAYLLQALTHSSYTQNRVTLSYEKLEFLGDAILDFLITCYIYESCGSLNPGELTDLRSALVNNNTFLV